MTPPGLGRPVGVNVDELSLRRFMRKVSVKPNGCWHWTGAPRKDGYGQFNIKFDRYLVHRLAYMHFVAPILAGLTIDHVCHNRDKGCAGGPCLHRRCVNPAHLEAVPRGVNVMRGRSHVAANALKTHCPARHEYDEANTFRQSDGSRGCRACRAVANAKRERHGTPNGSKTHCPALHEYTLTNTYQGPTGGRRCRQCARERRLKRQAA